MQRPALTRTISCGVPARRYGAGDIPQVLLLEDGTWAAMFVMASTVPITVARFSVDLEDGSVISEIYTCSAGTAPIPMGSCRSRQRIPILMASPTPPTQETCTGNFEAGNCGGWLTDTGQQRCSIVCVER